MDIKGLPKVELHLHLEGAIRISTLKELAIAQGITGIRNPLPGEDEMVPFQEYFQLLKPTKNLESFIEFFWRTQQLLNSYEIVERIAFECCQDAWMNGIRLLELRYTPQFIKESYYSDHSHMELEGIHKAVVAGIEKAKRKYDLAVGLIGIFDRGASKDVCDRLCDFYIKFKTDFCAVDLASNLESLNDERFIEIFSRCKRNGLEVTIHAGESGGPEIIQMAIEKLGAKRIGHGIRILEDKHCLDVAIQKGIILEVCPISNYKITIVPSYEEHPLKELISSGVKVCINTDDPGIFASNIIQEYELLSSVHGITKEMFMKMNIDALNSSFLSDEIKQSVYKKYFAP